MRIILSRSDVEALIYWIHQVSHTTWVDIPTRGYMQNFAGDLWKQVKREHPEILEGIQKRIPNFEMGKFS